MFVNKYNNDYTNIYRFKHIILGGLLGVKYFSIKIRLLLFIIIVIYQLFQLLFNIRFFLFSKEIIRKGNSIKHTINKLLDYLYGYIIVIIIYYIYK